MDRRSVVRSSAALSVLLHAAVFGLLGVSFASCTGPVERGVAAQPRVIQAEAVAPRKVEAYYRERRARERERLEALEEKKREQRKRLEQERRRAEALASEQRELQKRKQAERERRQALLQSKKRKAEEARRMQEQLEHREAERKRKERQARVERERKEREARRLAEEQRLRKEQQARRKAEEERLRKEQEARRLAEEQQRLIMRKRQRALWTRQYAGLLRASIERHWKKPPSSVKGGDCVLKLRQDENGTVLDLDVVSCDGDRLFVRSVEEAVWKASPLPSPPSPEVFDADVELTFRQKY